MMINYFFSGENSSTKKIKKILSQKLKSSLMTIQGIFFKKSVL